MLCCSNLYSPFLQAYRRSMWRFESGLSVLSCYQTRGGCHKEMIVDVVQIVRNKNIPCGWPDRHPFLKAYRKSAWKFGSGLPVFSCYQPRGGCHEVVIIRC